jgi:Arc/MetJ family transcription regulator
MRTTLDIDDDVLQAAKELAAAEKKTAGQVLSELARRALGQRSQAESKTRNGFELLPPGGSVVTLDLVDRLLEDE